MARTTKIPVLKIDDFLVASIQVPLDDRSVVEFQNDLLVRIIEAGARGVVVDITAVDVVDSFMARSLNDIAIAVHLLGAQMVIVGIQPILAVTLVEMGLTIPNAVTALNLEKGLARLRAMLTASQGDSPWPTGAESRGQPGEDDGEPGPEQAFVHRGRPGGDQGRG